jgi:DNA-binding response OmpR family regulator
VTVEILILTAANDASVLPALGLLPHTARTASRDVRSLLTGGTPDVILIDARSELAEARSTVRLLLATGPGCPVLAVVTEGGLAAINPDWALDDVILTSAGPAEVDARLRLMTGRRSAATGSGDGVIRAGKLTINPDTYAAKLDHAPLDLTYKEFELLKFLAQHPGRVFTRDQLLREVWGYDYFGGPRTVDVHVRRLRAKLGSEHESMIGTVRQVGYKFVLPPSQTALPALLDDVTDIDGATAEPVAALFR